MKRRRRRGKRRRRNNKKRRDKNRNETCLHDCEVFFKQSNIAGKLVPTEMESSFKCV